MSDARLTEVLGEGDDPFMGGGVLHRRSRAQRCDGENINTDTATDLVTACVANDPTLCPDCDWPEGAQAVVDDE